MPLATILVFIHVTANVAWIGSILSVAWITASATGDAVTRGRLAVEVYKAIAVPAFVISFLAGSARLALDLNYYFARTKFMHGKLFLALIVIAIHHVLGARAKKLAAGTEQDARLTLRLAVLLIFAAAGAVFLVIAKPF
jgi:putative membrane protein